MRLATRVALIGLAVLACTLVVVALLTYELLRVSGRRVADRALHRELDSVRAELVGRVQVDTFVTWPDLRDAAQRYLATHPPSYAHVTTLTIGEDRFEPRDAPPFPFDPEALAAARGTAGIRTLNTSRGPLRVLDAELMSGSQVIGRVTIASPLGHVERNAESALVRIAGAGAVALAMGGIVLVLATNRALRPAGDLAEAARRTGGADLNVRVPAPRRMDEIGVVAHEFNRMVDRLQHQADERRRLIGGVSHELRTPLAVARGHIELFEDLDGGGATQLAATGDPAVVQLLHVLRGELSRLERIADDLEAIAQGATGAPMEVGAVFAPDILDELRQRLTGLELTHVELDEAPPVVVMAEQHRVAQALLNLVVNAVTHTPAGTPVRVGAAVADGCLELVVADGGPGVDPAVRERVFEPFVSTRPDGGGLGLPVVKSLIEAQAGTVELCTGAGGTTVTVKLPLGAS